ncbi:hypothetical protein AURANDRAFT_70961, partial [Aureococcus anophagefferens]
ARRDAAAARDRGARGARRRGAAGGAGEGVERAEERARARAAADLLRVRRARVALPDRPRARLRRGRPAPRHRGEPPVAEARGPRPPRQQVGPRELAAAHGRVEPLVRPARRASERVARRLPAPGPRAERPEPVPRRRRPAERPDGPLVRGDDGPGPLLRRGPAPGPGPAAPPLPRRRRRASDGRVALPRALGAARVARAADAGHGAPRALLRQRHGRGPAAAGVPPAPRRRTGRGGRDRARAQREPAVARDARGGRREPAGVRPAPGALDALRAGLVGEQGQGPALWRRTLRPEEDGAARARGGALRVQVLPRRRGLRALDAAPRRGHRRGLRPRLPLARVPPAVRGRARLARVLGDAPPRRRGQPARRAREAGPRRAPREPAQGAGPVRVPRRRGRRGRRAAARGLRDVAPGPRARARRRPLRGPRRPAGRRRGPRRRGRRARARPRARRARGRRLRLRGRRRVVRLFAPRDDVELLHAHADGLRVCGREPRLRGRDIDGPEGRADGAERAGKAAARRARQEERAVDGGRRVDARLQKRPVGPPAKHGPHEGVGDGRRRARQRALRVGPERRLPGLLAVEPLGPRGRVGPLRHGLAAVGLAAAAVEERGDVGRRRHRDALRGHRRRRGLGEVPEER